MNESYLFWGELRILKEIEYVYGDFLKDKKFFEYSEGEIPFESVEDTYIVVCSYDNEQYMCNILTERLHSSNRIINAKQFFAKMDYRHDLCIDGREVLFWGCGKKAREMKDISLCSRFIDSNESINEFLGKSVIHPNEIEDWKLFFYVITVSPRFSSEIEALLKLHGCMHGKDYIFEQELQPKTAQLMIETVYSRPIKNFKCRTALHKVDFSADGRMSMCCPARISIPAGNLFKNTTIKEEWDSILARILKLSIVNNTYSFCSRQKCDGLASRVGKLEYHDLKAIQGEYDDKGGDYPSLPTMCIDYTCNLKCESCREDYRRASGSEYKKIEFLADKIQKEVMPNVDDVIMAGNGEVFYSPLYKKMITNESCVKRKHITIKSNGLLFNEANYNLIERGYENFSLHISIDAASKEIYESVRRGGNWKVLVQNMEFAAKLKEEGKIDSFEIYFVVQQKNYKDAKHFVELGIEWNCDKIVFTRIYNWGTYDKELFNNEISLFDNNGTGIIKGEFREYFKDPIFDNPKVRGINVFRNYM